MQKLITRRMDEMTSREVHQYFQAGGDLVLVPFGPISGHGGNTSLGIHAHMAHAFSLLLAEKANGLVYPPLYTCFSGATRTYRGSASFTIADQVEILKKITRIYKAQGFKRVVLVAGTTPENIAAQTAAREYFDETEDPVWMVVFVRLLEEPVIKEMTKGYPGHFSELVLDQAALKILGRPRPIPYLEYARKHRPEGPDQPADIHADIVRMRSWGMVGFRHHEEENHSNHGTAGLTFKGMPDVDYAIKVYDKAAEIALPALEGYSRYLKWLKKHPFNYITPTERLGRPNQSR